MAEPKFWPSKTADNTAQPVLEIIESRDDSCLIQTGGNEA